MWRRLFADADATAFVMMKKLGCTDHLPAILTLKQQKKWHFNYDCYGCIDPMTSILMKKQPWMIIIV